MWSIKNSNCARRPRKVRVEYSRRSVGRSTTGLTSAPSGSVIAANGMLVVPATSSASPRLSMGEKFLQRRRQFRPDAGHGGNLLDAGGAQPRDRAKLLQQQHLPL